MSTFASRVRRLSSLKTKYAVLAVEFCSSSDYNWAIWAATSQNYGVYGEGEALFITRQGASSLTTSAGLYDVSCRDNAAGAAFACNDGNILLCSARPQGDVIVLQSIRAHSAEVSSVVWLGDTISTCGWDATVRVRSIHNLTVDNWAFSWPPASEPVMNHSVCHAPYDSRLLAISNSTKHVLGFDTRQGTHSHCFRLRHGIESLSVDWSLTGTIVTAGLGGSILVWDIRIPTTALETLQSRWTLKHLRFARGNTALGSLRQPFVACGFDTRTNIWARTSEMSSSTKCRSWRYHLHESVQHHVGFVTGADWSWDSAMLVTGGWDRRITLYRSHANAQPNGKL